MRAGCTSVNFLTMTLPLTESRSLQGFSIASVTVVYDGENMLRRHLESIGQQTRAVNEIIVVNNASRDQTLPLLRNEYPNVTVLNLPENLGVGGALKAGLEYAALRKKHDWVWIFDQDSAPEADALQQLLDALQYLNGMQGKTAILAPLCVDPRTGMITHGLAWRGARLLPAPLSNHQPITFLDSVISSGSLIRRSAIESVGLPRADFFMDFVDHEHCLRLRRSGFVIAAVKDSRVQHTLGQPATFRFLGHTKYWSDYAPWREYYMTRNRVYTLWRHYSRCTVKAWAIYGLLRHALETLLLGKNRVSCLRMIYRGFIDGRAGRLGIRSSERTI